jgi:anti-anti-sigma factor
MTEKQTIQVSARSLRGCQIASVSGVVDLYAAGVLYDALMGCIRKGDEMLIVDLSGVSRMTRAGTRGLVVAAKLLESGGGQMRICGAKPAVDAVMSGLGFHHLLHMDATVAASMAALFPEQPGEAMQNLVPILRDGSVTRPVRQMERHAPDAGTAVAHTAA